MESEKCPVFYSLLRYLDFAIQCITSRPLKGIYLLSSGSWVRITEGILTPIVQRLHCKVAFNQIYNVCIVSSQKNRRRSSHTWHHQGLNQLPAHCFDPPYNLTPQPLSYQGIMKLSFEIQCAIVI